MSRRGRCPYTKSGKWPDNKLLKIIEDTLKLPKPKCEACGAEGISRGSGEVAWWECSQCGKKIGSSLII